jgi:hypothetical protein
MLSKDYFQNLEELKKVAVDGVKVDCWKTKATKVKQEGNVYTVKAADGRKATAKQVIIAATGPQQRPKTLDGKPDDNDKLYHRCIDAVSYMNSLQPNVKTVCIHGASATSSWAVKRAIKSGVKNIIWVARSGFSEANPAGRNNDVINSGVSNKWLTIGEIDAITVVDQFPGGADPKLHEATVELKFAKYDANNIIKITKDLVKKARGGASIYQIYKQKEIEFLSKDKSYLRVLKEDGAYEEVPIKDGVIEVNQYVYALGAEGLAAAIGKGSAGILHSGIAAKLKPVFDQEGRFGDNPGDTVVAFTDEDNLWVVGAAVFRAGPPDLRAKYANVTQMMPKGGQPPEGIAAVVASIKALTGVLEDTPSQLNPATADFLV